MKTFKHILVATDFGKATAAALEAAASLALTCDAKLTVLHVWEVPIYPYMDFMLNSEVITRVEDAAVNHLAEALESARKIVPGAQSMLKTGVPWAGIMDAVEETKPDLVVMGTHGRHGVERVMLGSVAEKLVRLSPVPVLTVRGSQAS